MGTKSLRHPRFRKDDLHTFPGNKRSPLFFADIEQVDEVLSDAYITTHSMQILLPKAGVTKTFCTHLYVLLYVLAISVIVTQLHNNHSVGYFTYAHMLRFDTVPEIM